MTDWYRPVSKVENVVVFGELHREKSSRDLLNSVIENHEFDAVCVEESRQVGYRNDRGGAIGRSLVWADKNDKPRYYVDIPEAEIVEAFGSRTEAYRYLKEIKKRAPVHDDGLVDRDFDKIIREEIRDKYGKDSFNTILTKRERLMAQRAKSVSKSVNGTVLLVVGASHLHPIVANIPYTKATKLESKFRRTDDRVTGGPWTSLVSMMVKPVKDKIKRLDFKSTS